MNEKLQIKEDEMGRACSMRGTCEIRTEF